MGLVLVEGFDHYDAGDSNYKGWNSPGISTAGRTGRALVGIINNGVNKLLPATYTGTVTVGAAIKLSAYTSTIPGGFFYLTGPGGFVVSVGIHPSTGFLRILDSASNEIGVGTTIIPLHSWFYLELQVVVGTSGTAELHLNGGTEIAATTGNFGTAGINAIHFQMQQLGGNSIAVDDVYVLDDSGSLDDFLGDIQVLTLYANGDGTYTDWTPLFGTDHYAMVDETIMDGDGSYNYDASAGDKDSFHLQHIGVGAPVIAAQLNLGCRKGDFGTRQIAPIIRQSGTDYTGSTFTLSSDYLFYSWRLEQDPSGSDWTATTINGDEYGIELIA